MRQEDQKKKSRIPEFANREEEAAFWDTHSLADYWDEFKPVKVRVAKKLSEKVTISLNPDIFKKACSLADEKGIPLASMIDLWVMERLEAEGIQMNPSAPHLPS